jgi:hypothetical protein
MNTDTQTEQEPYILDELQRLAELILSYDLSGKDK